MKTTYANLNQKSHFSCGIGIGKPIEIINKAKEKGLKGFAITDRFTAAGILDFYFASKKEKYPIALGIELFFFDHINKLNRIILIARNQEGYFNLCKLVSSSHNNVDMHKMPCISFYDLNEFKEGLYCLIDNYDYHSTLSPIFKDYLVYEIIFGHEHVEKNKAIILSGNKFVITCNAFLPDESYKVLQDIMVDNASYGSHKEVFTESKHILSLKELATKWQDHASYCTVANFMNGCHLSNAILEECSKIELKFHDQVVNFPHLLHPLNLDGCSKTELVWRIAKDYGRLKDNQIYKERFEYEMDAIQNNGRVDLIDYFLVLEDLCRWCRENGIMVGPGRGSGAGSLVNYCLKITHLDPIRWKLLFERFISKGRILNGNLPDVDIDFSHPEPVRQYLIEKYGHDRVIRIGTAQTLKAAGSVKDVARFFNPELDFQTINNVTRTFGIKDQEETELEFFERNYNENEVAKKFFDEYPSIRENVGRLLGYNRQYGTHPCGLAITQDSLFDFAPLRKVKGQLVLEFAAKSCEKSGIIKYDILGLMTLLFLQGCCDLVGIKDIYDIPLDDFETFKGFINGQTDATFQFNSDVANNILNHLPLDKLNLDLLSMTTSVGRPGPMKNGQHTEFYKRVNGERFSAAPHPALEEELKATYGIMIYQESVMKASQILGGFSLADADDIRRAMGKKDPKVLVPYKERFVNHCWLKYPDTKLEYRDEEGNKHNTVAEHIWDLMATFSGYGFNKSHSMSYALIGYYCQYLKTHYPLQWWISCLKVVDADKLKEYYSAAKEYCVDPDINLSEMEYLINENNKIQFPFSAIKGLGPKATEEIYKCRPFNSFDDFISRVNKTRVNKTVVLRLIYSGCFESLHPDQKQELINKYFLSRKEKVPVELSALTTYQLVENRINALSFLTVDLYEIHGTKSSDVLMTYETVLAKKPVGKSREEALILGTIKKITKKTMTNGNEYGTVEIQNAGEILKLRVWQDELKNYKETLKEKVNAKFKVGLSGYNNTVQLTLINMEII